MSENGLLTGLAMIHTMALGQTLAHASVKSRTIDALVLKRSSRVIPGFRGTPAGITTTSQPLSESYKRCTTYTLYFSLLF